MKKKIPGCVLACALILPCAAGGLAACGGESEPTNRIDYNIKMTIADYDRSMFDIFNGESVSFTTKDWYTESGGDHFTDAVRSKDGIAEGPGETDIRFNILINKKYFPDSIVVTEKDGKSFVKSTEMAEETGAQHNLLILTIPYASSVDYDFTVTCPTPVIKRLAIDPIPDAALTSDEPVVKDVLQNTKLYVADESGNAGLVNIATKDGNKFVSNLDGKHIPIDMSREPAVYATFDPDPKRIKYDNIGEIFGIGADTCRSINYGEIPGSNGLYGYKFEFYNSVMEGADAKLAFLSDNFGSDDGKVHYVKSAVNKTFTAYTVNNEYVRHRYKFELAEYREKNGDWTSPSGSMIKEYGKEYELKYKLADVEALFDRDDGTGWNKDGTRTDALKADTDYAQIKLALNGKSFDGSKTVHTEEGGVHYYTVKLGAEEIPYDFDGVAIKKESKNTNNDFEAQADVSSVKISGTSVNVKLSNGFYANDSGSQTFGAPYEFSEFETPDYEVTRHTVDGATNTFYLNSGMSNLSALNKFTLNVKFKGQTYTHTFQAGVDYFKPLSEKPEGFENLDLVDFDIEDYSYMPSFWTYLVGNADNSDADYISYYIKSGSLQVNLQATELSGSKDNDIEIYLTDVELRTITIETAGVAIDEGGLEVKMNVDGDVHSGIYVPVSGNKLYPNVAYDIGLSEKYLDYPFIMEFYANDKLVATLDKNEITPSNNVPSGWVLDGISTHGISSMGDDYKMTGVTFTIELPLRFDDAEHNSAYIMIDKIVIRVSERELSGN